MPVPQAAASPPGYSQLLQNLIGSLAPPSQKGLTGAFGNSPIVNSFASMMNQANVANSKRGQSILGLLAGQGQQQIAANQLAEKQGEAGIDQDLMSKGLGNSTIGSDLKQSARDDLMQQNEGVTEHSAMNVANVANSFSQQGPSMEMLAQLLQRGGNSPVNTGTTFHMFDPSTARPLSAF